MPLIFCTIFGITYLMTFQSFIACCSTSSECIFDQLYIFNNWQKMEKNLVIQPISTMTSKRKSPGFSNRTPHYLLHSSLPSGKWWWCFENKDSQQTGHQMVYTASYILYTNQWLEYNSMLVYTVVLSALWTFFFFLFQII